jgi:HSP20 family protein
MGEKLSYHKECLVYPGEYVPMPEIEAILEELKYASTDSVPRPLINMDEFNDYFKMEVSLPGVRREDIVIYMHENVLSICVLHKNSEELKKKFQIHEFETECLERHILLPENSDPEFISAEYKQGILSLHIPKTEEPSRTNPNQVVVY